MRGYAAVGLIQPKSSINVGSALRAAHCLHASLVLTVGRRYGAACTDTMKAHRHMPFQRFSSMETFWEAVPYDCVPVAVELVPDAISLTDYVHPQRALYLFGPEDGSIPDRIIERCRDVVQIPTLGCLNLAATVNVVLYDRLLKTTHGVPFK